MMMWVYIIMASSLILNGLLIWYVIKLLRKFLFISENLSDLFLTTKAFQVFVSDMYSMDSYHGEPVIENLVVRTREVTDEIEGFREIFQYTLDNELEDELDGATEKEEIY
tara:strand:- start:37264 stop:37593 length:330 start_codon:yes stop_codon:yes gene_type:complete